MSKYAAAIVVAVIVLVVGLVVVASVLFPTASKVGSAAVCMGGVQQVIDFGVLSAYDLGNVTVEQAQTALGDRMSSTIDCWCSVNTPTGNMQSECH